MKQSSMLFSPYRIKNLTLQNRITMAPMSVGYADSGGMINDVVLEHYRMMAASGAAMIVVENAAVHASGMESPTTLRADADEFMPGLFNLARAIHEEGSLAFLQINHAGRYSYLPYRIAPSSIKADEETPVEMREEVIRNVIGLFASAARRAKEAGFDGIEVQGSMGHLLVQFLSPRTNRRIDAYGGSLENRMRFPLEVVDAILDAVGIGYPVGYRFLADEWLPDGLHPDETTVLARELEKRHIAYLSITAGTYDSFYTPEYRKEQKREGFMIHFAEAVKEAVPDTPVIAVGGIRTPETANAILEEGKADLIGLARTLFADPLWPRKAAGDMDEPIIECEGSCNLCAKRGMAGLPAFCPRWDRKHRRGFLAKIREADEILAYKTGLGPIREQAA